MYHVFSVDDHIIERADVWSARVPARFKDAAPHVVRDDGRTGAARAGMGFAVEKLFALLAAQRVRPRVTATFPLEHAADALPAERRLRGKAVVCV
jgi:NADPH:quinone reductase-like Zn-dependent oxidoreductase